MVMHNYLLANNINSHRTVVSYDLYLKEAKV